MVCSLHESGWVSYQCDHLSPFSLRDNNSVWTGMRSMPSDGGGVIFPFSFPLECHIRPSVSPFIYLSYIITKPNQPTEGIRRNWSNTSSTSLPSANIMLWVFMIQCLKVIQHLCSFMMHMRRKLLSEARWQTERHRDKRSKDTRVVRKKKQKKMTQRKKICFMHLKTFTFWGIWAFSSNGAHCL